MHGHDAVGVDHDVAAETVVKVCGVESCRVVAGVVVGPVGRVVQHLVNLVVPGIKFKGSCVYAVEVAEELQGVHARESQLVRRHYVVKVCFYVGVDHLLKKI